MEFPPAGSPVTRSIPRSAAVLQRPTELRKVKNNPAVVRYFHAGETVFDEFLERLSFLSEPHSFSVDVLKKISCLFGHCSFSAEIPMYVSCPAQHHLFFADVLEKGVFPSPPYTFSL